jgi:hypothetical protein
MKARLEHHRRTTMEHHAGIDVSLELSSVCVVDATGRIVREAKVASVPEGPWCTNQAGGFGEVRTGV